MAYYIKATVSADGVWTELPKTGKKAALLALGAVTVTVNSFRTGNPSLSDGYMIVREITGYADDVLLIYSVPKRDTIRSMLLDGAATYTVLKHPDAFKWAGITGPET